MENVICLNCGHKNKIGSNYCEKCNVPLKIWDGVKDKKATERLQLFISAVEKVKSGEWSDDVFSNFIEATSGKLTSIIGEIKKIEIEIEKDIMPFFEEELDTGLSGTDMYMLGIDELRKYFQSKDTSLLDKGVKLIYNGNEKINEAIEINKQRKHII